MTESEAQGAAMRAALEAVMVEYREGYGLHCLQRVKDALSPDAGKRVLAVVEAAKDYLKEYDSPVPDATMKRVARAKLSDTLTALEKP